MVQEEQEVLESALLHNGGYVLIDITHRRRVWVKLEYPAYLPHGKAIRLEWKLTDVRSASLCVTYYKIFHIQDSTEMGEAPL